MVFYAKRKILVVDDDTNICELLRLYLEKEGYVVKIVNDGVSAINAFKQENPDLTLLDIMIPKLDGWQVCREIRKFSDKPIIMLTAKGETFDKVLGLELGADDYVTKPFDTKRGCGKNKSRTSPHRSRFRHKRRQRGKLRQALDKPYKLRDEGQRSIRRHSSERARAYISSRLKSQPCIYARPAS